MHKRNIHKHGYDFDALVKSFPRLSVYLIKTTASRISIDFANTNAVKSLNAALLAHHYGVGIWDIPQGYLCPPIPGRADYIHHIADLLAAQNGERIPSGNQVVGLDIGTGANVIYPIIGSQIYDWKFVGSETDNTSINSAKLNIQMNPKLKKTISIHQQTNPKSIFSGVIGPQDNFTFSMCNPPFHASAKEAAKGSQRKNQNLARNKQKRKNAKSNKDTADKNHLNFAGQNNELWCEGGELGFIKSMIDESVLYAKQVTWFTTLVSKKDNLKPIYHQLRYVQATTVKTIEMGQGNKISRFVAWQF